MRNFCSLPDYFETLVQCCDIFVSRFGLKNLESYLAQHKFWWSAYCFNLSSYQTTFAVVHRLLEFIFTQTFCISVCYLELCFYFRPKGIFTFWLMFLSYGVNFRVFKCRTAAMLFRDLPHYISRWTQAATATVCHLSESFARATFSSCSEGYFSHNLSTLAYA